jgi:SAM-dependent methyltransferase
VDVGGRIQPYRTLLQKKERSYVALDRQISGLVDVLGKAEELPFRSRAFDLVLCTQLLTYVSNPESVVAEAYRVLKPGGALILSAPAMALPHHDERIRILEEGFHHLMRDFIDVQVAPEIHSLAGVCRLVAQLAAESSSNDRMIRALSWIAVRPLNVIGVGAELVAHRGTRLTPNFIAFGRRRTETEDSPRARCS